MENLYPLRMQLGLLVENYWINWTRLMHIMAGEGIKMVTRNEAEDAVRTLLSYLEGEENAEREGLLKTPKRVIDSWEEVSQDILCKLAMY